jgi:hypothetical protein
LKAEKTFCSGSLRPAACRGKSTAMALCCDVEAARLLVPEPEGNIGALLVDCRLDWD